MTIKAVLVIYGVLTYYAGPYVGQPLRCGSTYDTTHTWIAVDLDAYGWHCGDTITVWSTECPSEASGCYAMMRQFVALDSGPLDRFCVEWDAECLPIGGDLPKHAAWWDGLSVRAVVVNRSAAGRRIER